MRRILPAVLAVVIASGCGGGDSDPASLDDCESVAQAAVAVIQQTIDVLEVAAGGTEPDPEAVAEIEAAGSALEARAEEIGCTEAEIAGLMAGLAGSLEAETALGQQIIEGLRTGSSGFFEEG